jgi:hypothetical protein
MYILNHIKSEKTKARQILINKKGEHVKKIILSFMFVCIGISLSFAQIRLERKGGAWVCTTICGMKVELPGSLSMEEAVFVVCEGQSIIRDINDRIANTGSPESAAILNILGRVERSRIENGPGSHNYNREANSGYRELTRIVWPEEASHPQPLIHERADGTASITMPS